MKGKVSIDDRFSPKAKEIQKDLNKFHKEALQEFKRLTPIDTGNARSKTTQQGQSIYASYPYAERLDNGYSKQAPDGMTKPFEKWLRDKITRIFK